MLNKLKSIDIFTKNIILVFIGTSLVNLFNLLYQLLIAHKLTPCDFAAFNTLLSIVMLISTPLAALQAAVIKYTAAFNAQNQIQKAKVLLSKILRKALFLAVLTLTIFFFLSFYIINKLKIPSISSGYILAILLASCWITPVFLGGLQGLELFKWFTAVSVISVAFKLGFAFLFIAWGFNIAGALGAFLISSLISIFIAYLRLKNFLSLKKLQNEVDFKEFFFYTLPVAISLFCFISLVSWDMVLVKFFFSPEDSGFYSLAQMIGKIFLFLPGAISIVMFPRTSGLNAKDIDTSLTLKKSLLYAAFLCIVAILIYNFFPAFTLKVLTGKSFSESIILGRLFSLSMSFFALSFILIGYFLSVSDLRFIKYLVLFTSLQFLAIVFFHRSLIQVQWILCVNAILLFFIHLALIKVRKPAALKI